MFGISGEHLLVLLVILLIFGPRRLPDLGHSVGRTLKNFKDAMNGQDNAATAAAPVQQIERKEAETASAPSKEKEAERV